VEPYLRKKVKGGFGRSKLIEEKTLVTQDGSNELRRHGSRYSGASLHIPHQIQN
jgi:hypothetical protein